MPFRTPHPLENKSNIESKSVKSEHEKYLHIHKPTMPPFHTTSQINKTCLQELKNFDLIFAHQLYCSIDLRLYFSNYLTSH